MISKYSTKGKKGYTAYGLMISSEIYFPELIPVSETGDIDIVFGEVPSEIAEPAVKTRTCQISGNQLLFYAAGAGHYYVENGNRIIVQPDEHADMGTVKLFILGTAFGALLLQRGMLPIHGSAVVINGMCTIFTGASGAGKSTLSSAFCKNGYSFLADDVSVITFDEAGRPWVQPGYPQQKLCRDSLEIIEGNIRHPELINADTDKYALPVYNHFQNAPARLAAMCELRPQYCHNIEMRKIFGAEKLTALMRNIYRIELLQWLGVETEFFKLCLDVVRDTAFYYMARPKDSFLLEEQMSSVKESIYSEE